MNIDGNLRNADWLRTRFWDVQQDVEDWLRGKTKQDVRRVLRLPVADSMPDDWRDRLERFLRE